MEILNIEIKANCPQPEWVESELLAAGAEFRGTDFQRDTYFVSREGRLKLREGKLENSLIHYARSNQAGPKQSDILLYRTADPALKAILEKALDKWVVVEKERKIFFHENVKFHIDNVPGLGHFVEIEAIDETGTIGREKLLAQCQDWMQRLNIQENDLQDRSYSDMLAEKQH